MCNTMPVNARLPPNEIRESLESDEPLERLATLLDPAKLREQRSGAESYYSFIREPLTPGSTGFTNLCKNGQVQEVEDDEGRNHKAPKHKGRPNMAVLWGRIYNILLGKHFAEPTHIVRALQDAMAVHRDHLTLHTELPPDHAFNPPAKPRQGSSMVSSSDDDDSESSDDDDESVGGGKEEEILAGGGDGGAGLEGGIANDDGSESCSDSSAQGDSGEATMHNGRRREEGKVGEEGGAGAGAGAGEGEGEGEEETLLENAENMLDDDEDEDDDDDDEEEEEGEGKEEGKEVKAEGGEGKGAVQEEEEEDAEPSEEKMAAAEEAEEVKVKEEAVQDVKEEKGEAKEEGGAKKDVKEEGGAKNDVKEEGVTEEVKVEDVTKSAAKEESADKKDGLDARAEQSSDDESARSTTRKEDKKKEGSGSDGHSDDEATRGAGGGGSDKEGGEEDAEGDEKSSRRVEVEDGGDRRDRDKAQEKRRGEREERERSRERERERSRTRDRDRGRAAGGSERERDKEAERGKDKDKDDRREREGSGRRERDNGARDDRGGRRGHDESLSRREGGGGGRRERERERNGRGDREREGRRGDEVGGKRGREEERERGDGKRSRGGAEEESREAEIARRREVAAPEPVRVKEEGARDGGKRKREEGGDAKLTPESSRAGGTPEDKETASVATTKRAASRSPSHSLPPHPEGTGRSVLELIGKGKEKRDAAKLVRRDPAKSVQLFFQSSVYFFEAACVAEALPDTNKYWKGASDMFRYVATQAETAVKDLARDPTKASAHNSTAVLQAVALKACAMSQMRHIRQRRKEIAQYLAAAKECLRTTPPSHSHNGPGPGRSNHPTPPDTTQTPPEFFVSNNSDSTVSPGGVSAVPSPAGLHGKAKAQQKDRDFLQDTDELLRCLDNWSDGCRKGAELLEGGHPVPDMPDVVFVSHWKLHALLKTAAGL